MQDILPCDTLHSIIDTSLSMKASPAFAEFYKKPPLFSKSFFKYDQYFRFWDNISISDSTTSISSKNVNY